MGASSGVPGSGGDISALSRSGQVAVVGRVSAGSVGCLRPCWRHRMAGPPVCRLPWDPQVDLPSSNTADQVGCICIEPCGARQAWPHRRSAGPWLPETIARRPGRRAHRSQACERTEVRTRHLIFSCPQLVGPDRRSRHRVRLRPSGRRGRGRARTPCSAVPDASGP